MRKYQKPNPKKPKLNRLKNIFLWAIFHFLLTHIFDVVVCLCIFYSQIVFWQSAYIVIKDYINIQKKYCGIFLLLSTKHFTLYTLNLEVMKEAKKPKCNCFSISWVLLKFLLLSSIPLWCCMQKYFRVRIFNKRVVEEEFFCKNCVMMKKTFVNFCQKFAELPKTKMKWPKCYPIIVIMETRPKL